MNYKSRHNIVVGAESDVLPSGLTPSSSMERDPFCSVCVCVCVCCYLIATKQQYPINKTITCIGG